LTVFLTLFLSFQKFAPAIIEFNFSNLS